MKPGNDPLKNFTLGSRLIFVLILALILADIGQTVYRFRMPTDGWTWHTGAYGSEDLAILFYNANLVGSASPLQSGDRVLDVAGMPVLGGNLSFNPDAAVRLAGIQAGDQIEYKILRGDRALIVQVPLTYWTLDAWKRWNTIPSNLLLLLSGMFLIGIGVFSFHKRPELLSARVFLVWCTSILCLAISSSLPDNLYNFLDPIAFLGVSLFSYSIYISLLAPSMLSFTLVFPRPKTIVQRHAWIALAPFFIGGGILAAIIADSRLGVLGWIGTMLMLLGSLLSMLHSAFTQKDAVSQAQLRWGVWGVSLGIGVMLLTFLPAFNVVGGFIGDIMGSVAILGFPIVGASLSIAIMRYRLFDIDILIRRTLVYTILSGLLAVVYFGSIVILQNVVSRLTGESRNTVVTVISTLAIAALFTPLRRRIQAFIDRRFYRRQYNAEMTLEKFGSSLRNEVDLESISQRLVSAVEETMQPETVSLWILR